MPGCCDAFGRGTKPPAQPPPIDASPHAAIVPAKPAPPATPSIRRIRGEQTRDGPPGAATAHVPLPASPRNRSTITREPRRLLRAATPTPAGTLPAHTMSWLAGARDEAAPSATAAGYAAGRRPPPRAARTRPPRRRLAAGRDRAPRAQCRTSTGLSSLCGCRGC